ncbi:RipA family octameric membrane protein [Enterobacter sp. C4G1]|uniref:RipA family octameric membrane protein n=1 Tax=Enterobacter sp. C4G1 TaxID=3458724 RepID=UPI004067ED3C
MYISRNVDYFEKLLDKRRTYFNCLKLDSDDLKKISVAFEKAHDIRKFEISLYWQRSTFLLGFMSVLAVTLAYCFSTYLDKDSSDNTKFILLLTATSVSLLGLIMSLIWKRIVKAGKYWQNNWEFHINILEPYVSGNLHKIHFYKKSSHTRFSIHDTILSIVNRMAFLWFIILLAGSFLIYNNLFPLYITTDLRKEIIYLFVCPIIVTYSIFELFCNLKQFFVDIFKKEESHISSNEFKITLDKFDFSSGTER